MFYVLLISAGKEVLSPIVYDLGFDDSGGSCIFPEGIPVLAGAISAVSIGRLPEIT